MATPPQPAAPRPWPLDVFISYAHEDETLCDELRKHLSLLQREGVIRPWHDRMIGAGSDWAGEIDAHLEAADIVLLLVSADFLASDYCHDVEMRRALERDEAGEARVVPVILRAVEWGRSPLRRLQALPKNGRPVKAWPDRDEALADVAGGIRRLAEDLRGGAPAQPPVFHAAAGARIDTTRLPTPGPHFVGRQAELAHLDAAWADPQVNVVSIVAFGGVGKSALVFRWLERLRRDNWRGATRVFAWSFYSQGTQERLASADAFIDFALRWCGDSDPTLGSPRDRGLRLAELMRSQRTLLILDGLEPLQHPPTALGGGAKAAGRVKDPGVAALLKTLAQANDGLCVVTTRERVAELAPHEHAGGAAGLITPESLSPEDGAELLRQLEVKGKPEELRAATQEYAGHALTLTLLGSYLRDACAGDVRRRSEIPLGKADKLEGDGHAFRVMAAYEKWLGNNPLSPARGGEGRGEGDADSPTSPARSAPHPIPLPAARGEGSAGRERNATSETPALAILRLLGLFDRPAAGALLAALRAAPPIAGLTEPLLALSNDEWQMALTMLRRRGLLLARDAHDPEALDAHPLVRAYFAERLEQERPDAWRAGHLRLYEHLCRAAPDQPDTLEEMMPLFQAVIHGCRAGRVQEARTDVHRRRVLRGDEHFSWKKLGAFGAELAALAGFFERPWDRPSPQLTPAEQAFVLALAGFHLRALGRLREALQPMQASLDADVAGPDWKGAAISAGNLSESTLTLGDVTRAMAYGRQSVELADRSGDAFQRMARRTTLADALHQAGQRDPSAALFREAEALQAEWQPQYPRLYSLQGYRHCDLLLSLAEPDDGSALDRAIPLSRARGGEGSGEGEGDSPTSPTRTAPHPIPLPAARGEGSADRETRASGDSTASAAMRAMADASAMRYRQACSEVADRAAYDLASAGVVLLDIALDHLSLGRAHLGLALTAHVAPAGNAAQAGDAAATDSADAEAAFAKAAEHLDHAVEGLRKSGRDDCLPWGLIARAAFHRVLAARTAGNGSAAAAHASTATARTARAAAAADLTEALDIATRGEMRLHLADAHREWTRLHLDQGEIAEARKHHEQARQLVAETGYHRRDREVTYLAQRLAATT